ncbi:hypothetical protein [Paramesorhizobium deserti]|uniref:hypothetical protein n=1 Tax=Paramesorhizobium deserti TaxID=1494590 RepID=UPI0026AB3CFB
MIALLTLSVVLIVAMCSLAYMLATYAVPFLFAVMVTRFAFATGAGYPGAGIVGLFAGVASYGFLPIATPSCACRNCVSPSS